MSDCAKKFLVAFVMLIALYAASACSSSSHGDPVEEPTAQAQPEPSPAPANPLLASRWCRAEDWDDFQVVLRMTIKDSQFTSEYLRLTSDGFVVYEIGRPMKWEIKGQLAPTPDEMSVAVHDTDADIQALPGFAEQKRIATEVFKLNPNLSHPDGDFAPKMAITATTRSGASSEEIERNAYPCESFSSTLNGEGKQRPLIEMIMIFASNSKNYTDENRGALAASMKFAYPLDEAKVETANIANTQWCAWRQVSSSELLLKTLTIGTDSFVENAHSQIFTSYFDPEELQAYLTENASHSEKFQMAITADRLAGKNLTPADKSPRQPPQELFTMVQDASGTKALVRMDYKEPDRSWPVFSDVYFDCADPRPLQFSPAFQERLPDILTLQKAALTGP